MIKRDILVALETTSWRKLIGAYCEGVNSK
jgi:hypothetical protein